MCSFKLHVYDYIYLPMLVIFFPTDFIRLLTFPHLFSNGDRNVHT